jgi:hypothetical protein
MAATSYSVRIKNRAVRDKSEAAEDASDARTTQGVEARHAGAADSALLATMCSLASGRPGPPFAGKTRHFCGLGRESRVPRDVACNQSLGNV